MPQIDRPKLKVSRRGLELIKSFEGFRPRAERLDDGRWVIGHGHTLSAREGAQVTAQEAELLLQYDLLPILNVVAERVSLPLNQHQVDALASYGLNLGVERFLASEVLVWINAGEPEDAARALSAHAEGGDVPAPDPTARRRAAESALFRHDPNHEADLAALLSAPVTPVAPLATEIESPPLGEQAPEALDDGNDARAMAVAVLLGEAAHEAEPVETPRTEAEIIRPVFQAPSSSESPAPDEPGPSALDGPPVIVAEESTEAAEPVQAQPEPTQTPIQDDVEASAEKARAAAMTVLAMNRHSPYAMGPVRPLPLDPAADAPEPAQTPPSASLQSAAASAEVLILTPPPEVEPDPPTRDAWPESARGGPAAEEETLFIEDPALRMGGQPVFMPENFEPEPDGRFDWSETGAFLGMGAVGVAAFGAAIAGFRMAADRPASDGLDQTTMAAWVLAVIGAVCVGVSAYNLYLRWSRRGED